MCHSRLWQGHQWGGQTGKLQGAARHWLKGAHASQPGRLQEAATGLGIQPPTEWLEPAQDEHFEVLQENWQAVTLFLMCDSQWTFHPLSGMLASLSQPAILGVGRLLITDPKEMLEVLEDIKVIDATVVLEQKR